MNVQTCPPDHSGTIAVGMSGGVDSTVAACMLQRQGYDVVGVTMQVWDGSLSIPAGDARDSCYSPDEGKRLEAIRALCARLGIRHCTVSLASEYRQWVLDYFRGEYAAGRTPNPCVMCNLKLKFGFLPARARAAGVAFDYFATGHYVRVERDARSGRYLLKRGLDVSRDQSYFLYRLAQEQLRALLFPLGALKKTEVRALAREVGLERLAEKQGSRDFIANKYYDALFGASVIRPGPVIDAGGRVLGEHRGIMYYTIGQRKGLSRGGTKTPLYVLRIDAPENTVTVGPREALFADRLQAADVNWIAFESLHAPLRVKARIRYQHREADALVKPDDAAGHAVTVLFDEPQMAVARGQAVVFYQGDLVLGGGTITG